MDQVLQAPIAEVIEQPVAPPAAQLLTDFEISHIAGTEGVADWG